MRPLLTASLLALTLGVAACSETAAPPPPPAVQAQGARLTLRLQPVDDLKPVAASVVTRDMAEARARIGGTLTELRVREGDEVRKGQLIGRVSDQRLTLETTAYDAQAAAAAAEAARASAELSRVQVLYDKGFYAKARLEQAQAAARAAEGMAAAARAQRAASAEMGSQGAILAPSSGRVVRADVPAGSVVAGGQSVATITSGEPLLRLELPEGQARALRVGDQAPVSAADLPGLAAYGTVVQVYPSVTGGQVTADLRVEGLRADLIGQRVRVQVKVGEREALVVPKAYVATRFGLDFIRLIGPDGAAREVAVQATPAPTPGQVEILSGAQAGDVLIPPAQGATR
ncbi:MAG: efflux RND transporter periplasmic adaptor subunit [Phenylobacterium sp.]|uniref:efflux RND transporter periplasmic adaptor subunit n=1 Tax=Phenylobacterium sp. TaxID=1871053 RepID=UPI00271DFB13|nr:efflux RND transporter periplasmic adaptor subunit [Phenylobacterium sp.]MDO8902573.1 efflux RND transporter periplasmic adaptor subunit [Phenylobacterium sp.]MDP2212430.1 efflux RND transporter periplasmic adaptor subunit [Phenylobacterium sp.]